MLKFIYFILGIHDREEHFRITIDDAVIVGYRCKKTGIKTWIATNIDHVTFTVRDPMNLTIPDHNERIMDWVKNLEYATRKAKRKAE